MTFTRLSAALALATASLSAHAALADAAWLRLETTAVLGERVVTDVFRQDWGASLSPLAVGGQTTLGDELGNAVDIGGSGEATWVDANAGRVSFTGMGWEVDTSGIDTAVGFSGRSFAYAFTTGAADRGLVVDYGVTAEGDLFGLQGWQIEVEGGPETAQFVSLLDALDPSTSGRFEATLTPGQSYTLWLISPGNVSNPSGFALAGRMDATFDWRIQGAASPVPEPGAFALAALALGLCGAAGRAARRARL